MATQPRLEALLSHWQEYDLPCDSQPNVIKELSGGLSNQSFLLQADKERWVLRLNSPDAEFLGVNREREYQIHQLAAEAGLAPTCIKADQKLGFFITKYIEEDLVFTPRRKGEQLDCLHSFFIQLHKLSLDLPPFNYADQLRRLIGHSNLPDDILGALEVVDADSVQGICHHDPNPNNVLFTQGKMVVIDWEYAALGNPVMDLAGIVHEWPFSTREVSKKFNVDLNLLRAGVTLYAAMSRYWALKVQRLKNL